VRWTPKLFESRDNHTSAMLMATHVLEPAKQGFLRFTVQINTL
jgi:hypothetical protein